MDDELLKVFITMTADPDMKMRAWGHAVEELLVWVNQAVAEGNWSDLTIYGPDSGAFSFYPAVCIEAVMPAQIVAHLRDSMLDNPWLYVPVTINVVKHG